MLQVFFAVPTASPLPAAASKGLAVGVLTADPSYGPYATRDWYANGESLWPH